MWWMVLAIRGTNFVHKWNPDFTIDNITPLEVSSFIKNTFRHGNRDEEADVDRVRGLECLEGISGY
jgi:hypothetical protein